MRTSSIGGRNKGETDRIRALLEMAVADRVCVAAMLCVMGTVLIGAVVA